MGQQYFPGKNSENCSVGEFRLNQPGDISQKRKTWTRDSVRLLIELPHGRSRWFNWTRKITFASDARGWLLDMDFMRFLYQVLFEKMGNSLSREQGKLLEKLLYQMFQKKKIPYLAGKISGRRETYPGGIVIWSWWKGQVDVSRNKKCPLPQSYETMDDVEVFKTLGKGLFYAQEQILAHRLRLKQKGMIELYDEQGRHLTDYKNKWKRVLSVSICMPEYDFFTERQMVERILRSGGRHVSPRRWK